MAWHGMMMMMIIIMVIWHDMAWHGQEPRAT